MAPMEKMAKTDKMEQTELTAKTQSLLTHIKYTLTQLSMKIIKAHT